jgi:hypothetical protein
MDGHDKVVGEALFTLFDDSMFFEWIEFLRDGDEVKLF